VDRFIHLHEKISQEMQFVAEKIKIYYNRTRFKNITLKKNLLIYTKYCDEEAK